MAIRYLWGRVRNRVSGHPLAERLRQFLLSGNRPVVHWTGSAWRAQIQMECWPPGRVGEWIERRGRLPLLWRGHLSDLFCLYDLCPHWRLYPTEPPRRQLQPSEPPWGISLLAATSGGGLSARSRGRGVGVQRAE